MTEQERIQMFQTFLNSAKNLRSVIRYRKSYKDETERWSDISKIFEAEIDLFSQCRHVRVVYFGFGYFDDTELASLRKGTSMAIESVINTPLKGAEEDHPKSYLREKALAHIEDSIFMILKELYLALNLQPTL